VHDGNQGRSVRFPGGQESDHVDLLRTFGLVSGRPDIMGRESKGVKTLDGRSFPSGDPMPDENRRRGLGAYLLLILLIRSVTLALAEASLRLFFERRLGRAPANAEHSSESKFWQRDESLGWSHIPGASGHFTNGAFDGEVHIDSFGNRRNSPAGTFVSG